MESPTGSVAIASRARLVFAAKALLAACALLMPPRVSFGDSADLNGRQISPATLERPGAALGALFLAKRRGNTVPLPMPDAGAGAPPEVGAGALESFIAAVADGDAGQVAGIYVEDVLAFAVGGQPAGNAGFVTNQPDEVTQFGLADLYGSRGFLAHNHLAGATFFELAEGQIITLVYGDGSTRRFQIESIQRFQALEPRSSQSRFRSVTDGRQLSASELFYSMYDRDDSVVLQTCIANEGIDSWGRLFVIATPVS